MKDYFQQHGVWTVLYNPRKKPEPQTFEWVTSLIGRPADSSTRNPSTALTKLQPGKQHDDDPQNQDMDQM